MNEHTEEEIYQSEDGYLLCEECGREYAIHRKKCPFCEAEAKAAAITKRGSYQPRSARLACLLLALVLVVGGVMLYNTGLENGGWSIDREYEEDPDAQTITVEAGITEQQSQLDSVETVTPDTVQIATDAEDEAEESDGVEE